MDKAWVPLGSLGSLQSVLMVEIVGALAWVSLAVGRGVAYPETAVGQAWVAWGRGQEVDPETEAEQVCIHCWVKHLSLD